MKKNFRTFILKCFIIASPFLVLLVFYYIKDPFMVIRKYRNYDKSTFVLNSNVVGWNTYLNHKDSLKFNSFIFGNSCTMAFKCTEWEKHLDKDDRAIRLYCEAENATSIYAKLKALEESGADIKNALLILDNTVFKESEIRYGPWRVLPPEISKSTNFDFQLVFAQTFMTPKYFIKYFDYNLYHTFRKGMGSIIKSTEGTMDSVNCDFYSPDEIEIEEKGEAYWIEHEDKFNVTKKIATELPKAITEKGENTLEDINQLCKKHGTNLKVILTPYFYKQRFNGVDKAVIESVFGKENVFDFTESDEYHDKHYYYDKVHFRPLLGKVIMDKVYDESNKNVN